MVPTKQVKRKYVQVLNSDQLTYLNSDQLLVLAACIVSAVIRYGACRRETIYVDACFFIGCNFCVRLFYSFFKTSLNYIQNLF